MAEHLSIPDQSIRFDQRVSIVTKIEKIENCTKEKQLSMPFQSDKGTTGQLELTVFMCAILLFLMDALNDFFLSEMLAVINLLIDDGWSMNSE